MTQEKALVTISCERKTKIYAANSTHKTSLCDDTHLNAFHNISYTSHDLNTRTIISIMA